MKTLKELISDGLPVGALLKDGFNIYQFYSHNGMCTLYNLSSKSWATVFYEFTAEPTTAYDSDIDPETLPIPEPFWTGWVVVDRMKDWVRFPVLRYHYSGDLMTEIECSDKMNPKLSPTDCQPCLPPA